MIDIGCDDDDTIPLVIAKRVGADRVGVEEHPAQSLPAVAVATLRGCTTALLDVWFVCITVASALDEDGAARMRTRMFSSSWHLAPRCVGLGFLSYQPTAPRRNRPTHRAYTPVPAVCASHVYHSLRTLDCAVVRRTQPRLSSGMDSASRCRIGRIYDSV